MQQETFNPQRLQHFGDFSEHPLACRPQQLALDLVVVRFDESVSVLYGRCLHRGALLSDGAAYTTGTTLVMDGGATLG